MNAAARYTRTAMLLHWLIAGLIVVNVALALTVDLFPDELVRPVIDTHKSIGITVLGLVILRLLWRAAHRPPALPASYPRWERFSAHAAHAALYLVILGVPISGWMHDSAWNDAANYPMSLFWLIPWPRLGFIANLDPAIKDTLHGQLGAVHRWFGYGLYALFVLHVAGALKHQFLDKEPELQRMLPGGR
ncbi:MAG TPA: cytochrome b [Stellaceae bacterium]|nr:cytochrome b [Stellaceae bacterium]